MTLTQEALLSELTKELRALSEAYVRLETTVGVEIRGLRDDVSEIRKEHQQLASRLSQYTERFAMGEARLEEFSNVRTKVSQVEARMSSLESTVQHTAPQKTPWTAVVAAVVAIGSLAWTLFGG